MLSCLLLSAFALKPPTPVAQGAQQDIQIHDSFLAEEMKGIFLALAS